MRRDREPEGITIKVREKKRGAGGGPEVVPVSSTNLIGSLRGMWDASS